MRLSLLSIVLALLLVMTAARRGTTSTPAPAAKKNRLVPQWGFPYGWGLGPGVEAEGMEVPELHKEVKQVKEVKRGTSMAGPIRNRIGISITHTIRRFIFHLSHQEEEEQGS
jgi:hypothetical protein